MEFENDLGLELLMNSKKKAPSDAMSLSSHASSIHIDRQSDISVRVEPVDVRQHLVPPSPKQSDEDDEEFVDEDDEEYSVESSDGVPQQQQFFKKTPSAPRMSEEDIINEKKELLYQFERLEKKGVRLPKKFTIASSLEDMRMEFERLKRDRELDNSIKFQKRLMMTAVSGIEFATDKFPAMGVNLGGWSNQVNDELDEYEDVFAELHDKYKGKAKVAPELRLLGGLAGSAFMYHLTHRWSQSLPGLDSVLKTNPELAAKLAEATRNQMNSQQQQQTSFFSGLGGMFGNMFGGGMPPPIPSDMAPQSMPKPRKKMSGPSSIDDVLSELNAANLDEHNDRVEMLSTISESEIHDDISSIGGLFVNRQGKTIDLDL